MTDPEKMITLISKRGYATGTTYISSNMRIINQYNLTKYDKQAMAALASGTNQTTPSDANKATQETSSAAPTQSTTKPATTSKKTFYRVQVGVFSTVAKRDKLIKNIKKKLDLDCFYEKVGGNYYVYCGSFQDRNVATQRVTTLKSNKFNAFIKPIS